MDRWRAKQAEGHGEPAVHARACDRDRSAAAISKCDEVVVFVERHQGPQALPGI